MLKYIRKLICTMRYKHQIEKQMWLRFEEYFE